MSDADVVKQVIASSAEPQMEFSNLSEEAFLKDIGIDSLKFMLMVIDIEQQLGRQIFQIDAVPEIRTVSDVIKLV